MVNTQTETLLIPTRMNAIRLHTATGPAGLVYEQIETPRPKDGEALVRVHAAAITRDELDWPVNRLPAIPSYEFSGVVSGIGRNVENIAIGEEVYALSAFDYATTRFEDVVGQVDLVFDTVGGERLERSPSVVHPGGRLASVASEPSQELAKIRGIKALYFVVSPNREQLVEIAKLVDNGSLQPSLDMIFPLPNAREAFERSLTAHTAGKIVLRIADR